MGKTYRGDARESFRKKNKKFKKVEREERQTKRSLGNSLDYSVPTDKDADRHSRSN